MNIFVIIFISFMVLGVINLPFRYYFDVKTMYKKSDLIDQHIIFILLFIIFGLIMFLFIKQIKEYRKYYYIKKTVSDYDKWVQYWNERKSYGPIPENIDIPHEEYLNYKRYLKLKKIKKNI
jgi:hypothetical protein